MSKQLKEGDVITIRGKGRVVLHEIRGNTRKDRINVILKKYM
jgi:RNA-binding protein YlmH